jgi:RNA-directed DNA polymerase
MYVSLTDKWLEQNHPTVKYVRYADDAILHCRNKQQAVYVLQRVKERMQQCGLELNPEKTKLVYCKDYRRQEDYPVVKFDFLGYSFQPRGSKSKKTAKMFLGFDCAVSINSKKRMAEKMKELNIAYLTHRNIVDVAKFFEPYIRGWVNYYGRFRLSEMNSIFQLLRKRLVQWARKRYKRYKTSINRAYNWLNRIREQFPALFYHWRLGYW